MSEQSGRSEPSDRRKQSDRDTDPIRDLQRWLIRSSARNMRRELEDQVRRTLGGQRQDKGDVWDVATTEIPPEVGAAPECQWCPICRAARRMRESGPGVAGPLSGAGEAVATVVQDAIGALDALLARSSGGRTADTPGADVGAGHDNTGSSARPAADQRGAGTGPAANDADVAPWATATAPDSATGRTDSGSAGDGSDGQGNGTSDRR